MQRRLNCAKCGGWGEWYEREQAFNLVGCDMCNGSGVLRWWKYMALCWFVGHDASGWPFCWRCGKRPSHAD